MISDILHDAAAEIRRYLKDMPHVYADTSPLIIDLLAKMDTVVRLLDTPPGPVAVTPPDLFGKSH